MARLIDADKIMADIATSARSTSKDYSLLSIARYIRIQPTIDAEPVRYGKWIEINTESGIFLDYDEVKCSECGFVEYFNKGWARFKYCPNCGAKMDEVTDE